MALVCQKLHSLEREVLDFILLLRCVLRLVFPLGSIFLQVAICCHLASPISRTSTTDKEFRRLVFLQRGLLLSVSLETIFLVFFVRRIIIFFLRPKQVHGQFWVSVLPHLHRQVAHGVHVHLMLLFFWWNLLLFERQITGTAKSGCAFIESFQNKIDFISTLLELPLSML